MILAALYILLMYQRTMQGPPRGVLLVEEDAPEPVPAGGATAVMTAPARRSVLRVLDLDRREVAVVAPLVALIILLGVYPQPLLNLIEPAVSATMSDLGGSAR
jgi:NADH-quinone oxidoreductase subunit M